MSAFDRRWLELRARCPSAGDRAALLADALLVIGGRAVEERDGWFVTHLEEPDDVEAFVANASDELVELSGLETIEIHVQRRPHEDWAEIWKRGIEARRVGHRVVVCPTWLEPVAANDDDIVIVLDPGVAFGTAEHGSTRGCLRLLERAVRPGDRVVDVGAGSGILSIAAVALGAGDVLAIEGDGLACEALAANAERNGVAHRVRVVQEWVDVDRLRAYQPAEGIVANLERGIVLPLLPGLVEALNADGWMIVSGILDEDWPGVEQALAKHGLTTVGVDADEGWRTGLLRLRA